MEVKQEPLRIQGCGTKRETRKKLVGGPKLETRKRKKHNSQTQSFGGQVSLVNQLAATSNHSLQYAASSIPEINNYYDGLASVEPDDNHNIVLQHDNCVLISATVHGGKAFRGKFTTALCDRLLKL